MRFARTAVTAVLLSLLTGCPTRPTQPTPGAEEFGLTILSVNLRDILNHPYDANGVRWQERYARIGRWVRGAPLKPDFIVLQEASGYWDCPTDHRRMPDYDSIDFLLDEIRDATGEQYRIAYFISDKDGMSMGDAWVGDALSGGCTLRGGNALLYRPSRVRNVLASVGDAFPYDTKTNTAPHSINSMPCCFPAADRMDVCSLIDGPPQVTPRCPTPSPSGAAWTLRHPGNPGGGVSEPVTSAVFDRFELVQQPGNFIHLYNVHLVWNSNSPGAARSPDAGVASINALVDSMETRFGSHNTDLLYPPILIGDFNLDTFAISHNNPPDPPAPDNPRPPFFPRFDKVFWSPANAPPTPSGLTGALIGKPTVFRSKQNAYVNDAHALPALGCEIDGGSPLTLWSDHCAVYIRIEPAP